MGKRVFSRWVGVGAVAVLAAGVLGGAVVAPSGSTGSRAASAACVTTESWVPTTTDYFRLPAGLFRSQGVTFNGKYWFFSWQYGLERTLPVKLGATTTYVETDARPLAIPPDLLRAGSDHIGDIDTYGKVLIAPIEDSANYRHPRLVLYNPVTLLPTGERYELPHSLLTEGVPWVAVDKTAGLAIVAEWNNTSVLDFFDIRHGMTLDHQVHLDRVVGRIQGAKVFDGALYASRDDADKTVIRIDIQTGHVTDLFALHAHGEMEGIAMGATSQGEMHVMFIHGDKSSVQGLEQLRSSLHHYRRVLTQTC